jgi:hypothetical protein
MSSIVRAAAVSALLFTGACSADHAATSPSSRSQSAPDVFTAGTYAVLISSAGSANACAGASAVPSGSDPTQPGGTHVGTVVLRPEGRDWVATSADPDDTLRIRFRFDDAQDADSFTGSIEGRAFRAFPAGAARASVDIHGRGTQGAATLSGRALDEEQGLGAIDAFGTVSGRLEFTNPATGAVTCGSGSVMLQRTPGL